MTALTKETRPDAVIVDLGLADGRGGAVLEWLHQQSQNKNGRPVWVVFSAALGLTVGPVMALPVEVLRPESRSTGMGLFYAIYYIGSGSLPVLAGWLQDISGSVSTVAGFSALSLMLAPVSLLAFRLLRRHYEFKKQKLILAK